MGTKLFVEGYQESNVGGKVNHKEAVTSLKYITLELTLRFIIDTVKQKYFTWDSKKYKSASEHNKIRALQFWDLYNQISKEL